VVHHFKEKSEKWKMNLLMNLAGAISTAAVLVAVVITKFWHGAWLVCFAIPCLVRWFYAVRTHYIMVGKELVLSPNEKPPRILKHTIIVPVASLHKGVLSALEYAKSLSPTIYAVYVAPTDQNVDEFQKQWDKWSPGINLTILRSAYRSVIEPLTQFIKEIDARDPDDLVTVVIPSFVPAKWWHNFLHNQTSVLLRLALTGMKNVVITSVNTHLSR